jgi:hypothetical protein
VRGWDDGRGVDAGRAFGSAQGDAFEEHYHLHGFDTNAATTGRYGATNTGTSGGKWDWESAGSETHSAHTSTEGGAETRPRNVALLYCIKAFDTVTDPAQVSAAGVIADVASNTGRIDALEADEPYVSPEQSISPSTTINLSHGLGAIPRKVSAYLVCKVAEFGYSVGDGTVEMGVIPQFNASHNAWVFWSIKKTPTQLSVIFGNNSQVAWVNSTSNVLSFITHANWRLVITAEL